MPAEGIGVCAWQRGAISAAKTNAARQRTTPAQSRWHRLARWQRKAALANVERSFIGELLRRHRTRAPFHARREASRPTRQANKSFRLKWGTGRGAPRRPTGEMQMKSESKMR